MYHCAVSSDIARMADAEDDFEEVATQRSTNVGMVRDLLHGCCEFRRAVLRAGVGRSPRSNTLIFLFRSWVVTWK